MSEQPDSQQPSEAASGEQNAGISEAMAADSEAPTAAANSEQPSTATSASAAPSDATSAATDASANSTQADLSNLTQTVTGGGGARSSPEKSASSPKPQRSPGAGTRSTTGAATHKSQEKTESKSPSTPKRGQQKRKRMKLGELDLSTAKIGFLGAGKMAESTINGLIHYGEYLIESIQLYLFVVCQPIEND